MSIYEWKIRAKTYDNIEWTKRDEYMEMFLKAAALKSNHNVCDIGTGTGIIAHALAQYCHSVRAIDISEDMLSIAKTKRQADNIQYEIGNAERLKLDQEQFDCVTARMVFHHIAHQNMVVKECARILKPGGRMVISEGIPPPGARRFFTEMFKLKEKRRTYILDDLVELLEASGKFTNIEVAIHEMKNVSISNWLDNSGLDKATCKRIYNMHLDCSDYIKEAYNMRILNGDIYMDWLSAIVSGNKQ